MSDSKRETLQSNVLNEFKSAYTKVHTQEEKDLLWNSITTPFIERISSDESKSLITFLYRKTCSESGIDFSFYVDCNAIGLPLTEKSRLFPIPKTDLLYLSTILPSTLRTTYSFLKLNETPVKTDMVHALYPFPEFSGELKKIVDTVMRLHAEKKVEIDSRNPKNISYHDYDNPDKCFFSESILELPLAPIQPAYISDASLINNERNKLTEEKRFFEYSLSFSYTSLKDLPEYQDTIENKDQPQRGKRKYWVYLPPDYNDKEIYPLCLFLDGSDYLNTIPVPSILERMIHNKDIPSCIAVFFEYSPDRRPLEYYGDDRFTHFLARGLIDILRNKHHLAITRDPNLTTIIGLSASGLAAVHAGLTCPDVFGNVIAQSAALWSKKRNDLEKRVGEYLLKKQDTFFCMEAGKYENIPAECRFEDDFTQAFSILEASMILTAYMKKNGINAVFHEFVGGHNYVCYRGSLPDRLKEVYQMRLGNINKF